MDNAVALIQAYLRVNGYLTVSEYPVVERTRTGAHRVATDLDILAFRFPRSQQLVPAQGRRGEHDRLLGDVDEALHLTSGGSDMLVGEVKEGAAELNRGARDPAVLRAMLIRFGCCPPQHADAVIEDLLRRGHAQTEHGHRIRLMAFGATRPGRMHGQYEVMLLRDVLAFLQSYIDSNWDVLHHAECKDPALGLLMTIKKAGCRVAAARKETVS